MLKFRLFISLIMFFEAKKNSNFNLTQVFEKHALNYFLINTQLIVKCTIVIYKLKKNIPLKFIQA
jgi:hypothetical protein